MLQRHKIKQMKINLFINKTGVCVDIGQGVYLYFAKAVKKHPPHHNGIAFFFGSNCWKQQMLTFEVLKRRL
jgi:hypothetical protein